MDLIPCATDSGDSVLGETPTVIYADRIIPLTQCSPQNPCAEYYRGICLGESVTILDDYALGLGVATRA